MTLTTYCLCFTFPEEGTFHDLAALLWNSFGTSVVLLQEIISIYLFLLPPNLTPTQPNRVCNVLALLQCVASHSDTKMLLLNAKIPFYFYPFLDTTSESKPFEYLRLTSLGVIGALVKADDIQVIRILLPTRIIQRCLRAMQIGSELSKTVATFILRRCLLDDVSLRYICTTSELVFAVVRVLGNMVGALAAQPSSSLLKHIIRCYLRLSDNPRIRHWWGNIFGESEQHMFSVYHQPGLYFQLSAFDVVRILLPDILRDTTFSSRLSEDRVTKKWLQQLLHNVDGSRKI